MNRFASLTSRLVITAVLLVAVVSLLIAGAATFALHSYLSGRLDSDVRALVQRLPQGNPQSYPQLGGDNGDHPFDLARPGTLSGVVRPTEIRAQVTDDDGRPEALSTEALTALSTLSDEDGLQEVDVPGQGEYRVATARAPDGDIVFAGLPTDSVDGPISTLILWELLVGALGIAVAAIAGTILVRRQLQPLRDVAATAHHVAELPLATGEIELAERVPDRLTDENTEVGQVGAALNTLLAHVESSLTARHESEQQVRQFVADASHELRTPLTTIAGYTELARRRPDDPLTTRTALDKVEEESARMTAMVEDLLLLARLDSGRPLERHTVDLSRLLVETVSDARVVDPGHRWQLDLPEESIEVTGDVQRLHQVVTNLLTNARKYTPVGTTITVSAQPHGFAVHDDGPGFPPGLAEHAFERFARGDAARTRGDAGGAGLGLALVQAIVTAHGGKVSLRSRPGDTEVTVTLPG